MADKRADKSGKAAPTVASFVAALEHPLKSEVVALRKLVLSLDPSISEEVKWNAPSFRATEHFATMHLRAKDSLQLILHLGAKSGRTIPEGGIEDPEGLLKWLGPDRASVTLGGKGALAANSKALSSVIRQWMKYV